MLAGTALMMPKGMAVAACMGFCAIVFICMWRFCRYNGLFLSCVICGATCYACQTSKEKSKPVFYTDCMTDAVLLSRVHGFEKSERIARRLDMLMALPNMKGIFTMADITCQYRRGPLEEERSHNKEVFVSTARRGMQ